MPNSRFGYSVKKNSFKGLNIDCVQYSNIIRITYYSYSYSGTILNPNIIRIRIRPNICARILFVFVFAHSEKTNIIRIRIRSKIWFRILFVFVFGPKNSIRSPLTCNKKEILKSSPLLEVFWAQELGRPQRSGVGPQSGWIKCFRCDNYDIRQPAMLTTTLEKVR